MKEIQISGIVDGIILMDPEKNIPVFKVDESSYQRDEWIKTSWGVMRAADIVTMWLEGNKNAISDDQKAIIKAFLDVKTN